MERKMISHSNWLQYILMKLEYGVYGMTEIIAEKNDNIKSRKLKCKSCEYNILSDKIGLRCPHCDALLYTEITFMTPDKCQIG